MVYIYEGCRFVIRQYLVNTREIKMHVCEWVGAQTFTFSILKDVVRAAVIYCPLLWCNSTSNTKKSLIYHKNMKKVVLCRQQESSLTQLLYESLNSWIGIYRCHYIDCFVYFKNRLKYFKSVVIWIVYIY